MDPAALSRVLTILRDAGPATLVVRLAILLGAVAAVVAVTAAPWDAPNAFVVVAVLAAAGSVALPDSAVPLVFTIATVGALATRGRGDIDGWVVIAALGLLVVHVGCALGAAAPLPVTVDARIVRRWARPTAVLAGATVAAAGALVALTSWGPAGSLGVSIAALVLIGLLALWWMSEA